MQVYEQSVGRGLLGVCAESWVRTGRRATEMVAAAPQCHWPLGAGQMLMCVLCLRKRATENIARAAVGLAAAEREQCTGRGRSSGGGRCCRRRRCRRRRARVVVDAAAANSGGGDTRGWPLNGRRRRSPSSVRGRAPVLPWRVQTGLSLSLRAALGDQCQPGLSGEITRAKLDRRTARRARGTAAGITRDLLNIIPEPLLKPPQHPAVAVAAGPPSSTPCPPPRSTPAGSAYTPRRPDETAPAHSKRNLLRLCRTKQAPARPSAAKRPCSYTNGAHT